jgi:hypothetical protein
MERLYWNFYSPVKRICGEVIMNSSFIIFYVTTQIVLSPLSKVNNLCLCTFFAWCARNFIVDGQ